MTTFIAALAGSFLGSLIAVRLSRLLRLKRLHDTNEPIRLSDGVWYPKAERWIDYGRAMQDD